MLSRKNECIQVSDTLVNLYLRKSALESTIGYSPKKGGIVLASAPPQFIVFLSMQVIALIRFFCTQLIDHFHFPNCNQTSREKLLKKFLINNSPVTFSLSHLQILGFDHE